jgi:hypothetical protein
VRRDTLSASAQDEKRITIPLAAAGLLGSGAFLVRLRRRPAHRRHRALDAGAERQLRGHRRRAQRRLRRAPHHAEQYAKWKAFGLRFQASAPIAEKLYDAALASKDDSVRGHAEAILHDFEAELGEYIALSLRVAHPDGGP